jgi:hypothetical protein
MEPQLPGVQPPVPVELSAEEAVEWELLTSRMPPDWFPPETWPMLAQLCRHICQCRWIGKELQAIREGSLKPKELAKADALAKMHEREGRAMSSLMLRLRLTSSTRMADDQQVRKQRAEIPAIRPWQ